MDLRETYEAYSQSLHDFEVGMVERDMSIDHSTVHRWVAKLMPQLEKMFREHRKAGRQELANGWHIAQLHGPVEVFRLRGGQARNTIDFLLPAHCDKPAVRRLFGTAIGQNSTVFNIGQIHFDRRRPKAFGTDWVLQRDWTAHFQPEPASRLLTADWHSPSLITASTPSGFAAAITASIGRIRGT